jgi:hypothetical protein
MLCLQFLPTGAPLHRVAAWQSEQHTACCVWRRGFCEGVNRPIAGVVYLSGLFSQYSAYFHYTGH